MDAGVVDSWPSYVGSLTLLPDGTKRSRSNAYASLNNQPAIDGNGGGYTAAHSAPSAYTVIAVWRVGAAGSTQSLFCHTAAGAVNTGQAVFKLGGGLFYHRTVAGDINPGVTPNDTSVVTAHTFANGQATSLRINSTTKATGATTISNIGDTLTLFALNNANANSMTGGAIARWVLFPSVLSDSDIASAMNSYGAIYGITIA